MSVIPSFINYLTEITHEWFLDLYIDVRFINIVCKSDKTRKHPIYAVHQDIGCFELSSNNLRNTQLSIENILDKPKTIKTDI